MQLEVETPSPLKKAVGYYDKEGNTVYLVNSQDDNSIIDLGPYGPCVLEAQDTTMQELIPLFEGTTLTITL